MYDSIASRRVLLDGQLQPATVYIENGKISRIEPGIQSGATDFGDYAVLPGLVDTHVHFSEPGRTEWEGFETGTKSAAAGGVTTVVEMPLNAIPPTTSVQNFELKLSAAENKCWVDVGFWGGLIPGNSSQLIPMMDRGVRGFKCFMIKTTDTTFPNVSLEEIDEALEILQGKKTIMLFHAEYESCDCHGTPKSTDPEQYSTYLESRPEKLEVDAIKAIVAAMKKNPDVDLHIVHLGSAEAIPIVAQAQKEGGRLSAETCFHYLVMSSEEVPEKETRYKCAPPIRTKSNQDALWDALKAGTIASVVSDHSPCTPDMKVLETGDFMDAWAGISGIGLGLSVLWTQADERQVSLADISRWTSTNPARQGGLDHKGSIAVGKDADFCIFDTEEKWSVDETKMHFKNKLSAFNGMALRGLVRESILAGRSVFKVATEFGPATGRLLLQGNEGQYHRA